MLERQCQGIDPEDQQKRQFTHDDDQERAQQYLDQMTQVTPAAKNLLGDMWVGHTGYHQQSDDQGPQRRDKLDQVPDQLAGVLALDLGPKLRQPLWKAAPQNGQRC